MNNLPNNNCEDWDRNLLQEIGYFLDSVKWAFERTNNIKFSISYSWCCFKDLLHRRNGKNAIYTWK